MSAYTVIEFGYGVCEECDTGSGVIEEFAAEAWAEQHDRLFHPKPGAAEATTCPDCVDGKILEEYGASRVCATCGGWGRVLEPGDT